MHIIFYLGLPATMSAGQLKNCVSSARSIMEDEMMATPMATRCPDPAGPSSSGHTLDVGDIAGLRRKFSFLKDFSDEFIRKTPLEVLLKTETTAIKIREYEKNKAAGDRLSHNRDELANTFIPIKLGADNRWNVLHESRFLPGACCTATAMWLRAREVIGLEGHVPVATYDMQSIGLGGFVSKRGWVELHQVGSDALTLKMFNINSCGNKVNSKGAEGGDEFKEVTEFGEYRLALRVAREAMSFVHPWNKSLAALEGFIWQTDFCRADLAVVEKPATVLSQFSDYILGLNADRWRGQQPFVTTGEMKGIWDSFWGAKPESKLKPKSGAKQNKSGGKFTFELGFFDDICRMYNLGKCTRAPGTCTTRSGIPLRHICNFRTNPAKPQESCGKGHMAIQFHPPPTSGN
jgi:hypothetical protein